MIKSSIITHGNLDCAETPVFLLIGRTIKVVDIEKSQAKEDFNFSAIYFVMEDCKDGTKYHFRLTEFLRSLFRGERI